MSSLRLTPALLRQLHDATPPGTPLAQTVATALELAGGPEAVRDAQASAARSAGLRALGIRRRARGDRSVTLEPGQQEALADVTAQWVALLERVGQRRFDRKRRVLWLDPAPPPRRERGDFQMRRRGGNGPD